MTSHTCLSTHSLLVRRSLIWMLRAMNLYPERTCGSKPDGPMLLRIRCMQMLGFVEMSWRHMFISATVKKTIFSLRSTRMRQIQRLGV